MPRWSRGILLLVIFSQNPSAESEGKKGFPSGDYKFSIYRGASPNTSNTKNSYTGASTRPEA
jgi:hypothetical protein